MRKATISTLVLFFMLLIGCENSIEEVLETSPTLSMTHPNIDESTMAESVQTVQILMESQPFDNLLTTSQEDFLSQLDSIIPDSLGIQQEILENVQQTEFLERLPDETLVEYFEKAGVSEAVAEKFTSLEDDMASLEDLEEEFVTSDGFLDVEKLSDSVKDKFTKIKEDVLADNSLEAHEKLAVLVSLEMMIGMNDDIVMMAVDAHVTETSPVAKTEGLFKKIGNTFKKVIKSYVKVASMVVSYSVCGALINALELSLIGGSAAGISGATTGALVGAALGYGYGVISALDRVIDNDCGALGKCFD